MEQTLYSNNSVYFTLINADGWSDTYLNIRSLVTIGLPTSTVYIVMSCIQLKNPHKRLILRARIKYCTVWDFPVMLNNPCELTFWEEHYFKVLLPIDKFQTGCVCFLVALSVIFSQSSSSEFLFSQDPSHSSVSSCSQTESRTIKWT